MAIRGILGEEGQERRKHIDKTAFAGMSLSFQVLDVEEDRSPRSSRCFSS